MGGKASAPPAPDYVGAATTQAAASEKATANQNFANRPSVYTPFGNQTWNTGSTIDPATGNKVTTWQQNVNLDPELQRALDSQIATQQGRSDLAAGFMGRVAQEYSQPFNWYNLPSQASAPGVANLDTYTPNMAGNIDTNVDNRSGQVMTGFGFAGPQSGVSSQPAPMSFGVNNTSVVGGVDPMANQLARSTDTNQLQTSFNPMTAGLKTDVSQTPLITDFRSNNYQLARNTGTEDLQRSLTMGDNPALPQFDTNYRDTVARTLMERMVPLQERQQQRLQTQLSNQGFQQGSEAYKRALDELNMRQAGERYNALDTAGNEAQRLYNMQMGARQQAFNEDVSGGQFANQAAQAAFNQGLSANQFQNQAAGQAYNQQMGAKQAFNQAQQQAFNQALASGQFGNQAVQQAYAQSLGAGQAGNQALGQQFNQGLAANQFANQATQQAYNQNLGAAQFANQAAGQAFNQGLAGNQFQNQAANQLFNQNLAAGQFGNQAQQQLYNQLMGQAQLNNAGQQQAFNQDLAASQFGNQAVGQQSALDIAQMNAQNQALQSQFGMGLQAAQLQNQLRQQAIAEQMQRRGMSLNEMNALLSGQQVQMPSFPSFNAAGRAETPNILGATQMGYDAALGAVNAQNANTANTFGGLFQLGAAAAPFMFSDRRLKSNIKRIGTHDIGVGVYEYTMMGMPQIGVLAQEVQKVRPDLVKRHASGYLMVNYGGL